VLPVEILATLAVSRGVSAPNYLRSLNLTKAAQNVLGSKRVAAKANTP
jgi:hypothetical protein